ncbi:response regulator transcription factor [Kineosporia sp. R_H_3]|uniref:response regulator transcription factor n=1 Tax=Kineosporia sp. R_H_3 TaxID=1961848 RepID=UPI000B4AE515|nr:response regulator [Kineosporia sp. R_H_3]
MANILVVDDDEDICDLIRLKLTSMGHDVHVVHDGAAAVTALHDQGVPTDLVLLDGMMPVMDGETTCRTLRADPRTAGLPVLMLSARGTPQDALRGRDAGADGYIMKPFSPRDIAAQVVLALERGRTPGGTASAVPAEATGPRAGDRR